MFSSFKNEDNRKNIIILFLSFSILIFAYISFINGINNHYAMFYDQTRDWRIASNSSLSLTGTQIATGGTSFGPIFYWV